MAKKQSQADPYEDRFEFESPVPDEHVGTDFTVRGICTYLKKPKVTISVHFTPDNDTPIAAAQVVPDSTARTFEAFFQGVDNCTGRLTAQTSNGRNATPVSGIVVEGLSNPIQIDVDAPTDGDSFPVPSGAGKDQQRLAPPETNGSLGANRHVWAYVTRAGSLLRINPVPVPTTGSGERLRFRLDLVKLFPNASPVLPGKYGLHFLVNDVVRRRQWIVSRGFFEFRAAGLAAGLSKAKSKKASKRPATKPASNKTSARKTVKKRK